MSVESRIGAASSGRPIRKSAISITPVAGASCAMGHSGGGVLWQHQVGKRFADFDPGHGFDRQLIPPRRKASGPPSGSAHRRWSAEAHGQKSAETSRLRWSDPASRSAKPLGAIIFEEIVENRRRLCGDPISACVLRRASWDCRCQLSRSGRGKDEGQTAIICASWPADAIHRPAGASGHRARPVW